MILRHGITLTDNSMSISLFLNRALKHSKLITDRKCAFETTEAYNEYMD